MNTPPTANCLRVVTEQSEVTLPENVIPNSPIPLESPKSKSIPIIPILEEIEVIDPQWIANEMNEES